MAFALPALFGVVAVLLITVLIGTVTGTWADCRILKAIQTRLS